MRKLILVLFVCLHWCKPIYAGISTAIMVEKGAAISGATLTVMDNQYDYMRTHPNWSDEFRNDGVSNRITLKYTGEAKKVYAQPWSISVNFTLKSWNAAGVEQFPVSGNLSINYNPATGASYKDVDVFTIDGGYKTQLIISPVSVPAGLTAIPTDVVIESLIETKRFFKLDPNTSVTTTFIANTGTPTSTNTLEIQWPFIKGAEDYDVEWVFVSDQRLNLLPIDRLEYEMENASRISTSKNFYTLNLLYDGDGTLYFRVRGVGRKGNHFELRQEGKWSTINKYHFTGFSKDRNWTYSASYAEEGKAIESATFFDGSGRNRQTVNKLNSENTAMVAETMYDFEGRPGIQTLPAPVKNYTRLDFYQQYSLNPQDVPYSAKDFHSDAYLTSPDCKPSATGIGMSTTNGASNYFSGENPAYDKGYNAVLPDAELYPFTQTVYDKEGKVRMQSSPGATHRIGNGHETKYFNSTVSQDNLDRLFGADIGKASHYSQKVVMDANGQLSVSYLDLSEKVVASFLTGDNNTNLDDLEGTEPTISESLTELNQVSEEALIIDAKFMVTSTTEYTFTYDLSLEKYNNLCQGVDHTCTYDLYITIFDDCDQPVFDKDGSVLEHHFIVTGPYTATFKVDFPRIGIYKIRKKLTLNQLALDIAVADFKAAVVGSCIPTLEQLIQEYKDNVISDECNPTSCETTCDAAALEKFPSDEVERIKYAENCKKLCVGIPETSCDVLKEQLEEDMSPGGQYFNYIYSVPWNILPADQYQYSAAWWFCDAQAWDIANFRDKNGNLIRSYEALQANWDPNFLYKEFDGYSESDEGCPTPHSDPANHLIYGRNMLIKFHPEYCHYEWCGKLEPSTQFDMSLMSYDSYDMANKFPTTTAPYAGGSPVGINILNADPYFSVATLGGFQKSVMENLLPSIYAKAVEISDCNACNDFWVTFRNLYLSEKEKLIRLKKSQQGCNTICDNTVLPDDKGDDCGGNLFMVRGKEIRFPASDIITNPTSNDPEYYTNLFEQFKTKWEHKCGGEGQPPCFEEHHCFCDKLTNLKTYYLHMFPDLDPNDQDDRNTLHSYIAYNLNREVGLIGSDMVCDTISFWEIGGVIACCEYSNNKSWTSCNGPAPSILSSCSDRLNKLLECDKIPECELPDETTWIYYANEQFKENMSKAVENFIAGYKAKCLRVGLETFDVSHESREYKYTLYYYDRAGNLEKTVPPEGVRVLNGTQITAMRNYRRNVAGSAPVYPDHILKTTYKYDSFNKLVAKESPDGGYTQFWYNNVGQLRFSANAKQSHTTTTDNFHVFSYTKYDPQGRIVEIGESNQDPPVTNTGTGHIYDLMVKVNDADFPTTNRTEVTRTYYDSKASTSIQNKFPANNQQKNLRSRVSTISFEEQGDNDPNTYSHSTHYSYDAHGNVNILLQDHPELAPVGNAIKKIEYEYDLLSGNVNKVSYQAGAVDQFYHRYTYDDDNRLASVFTSHDNIVWTNDAKYYYYVHGPLARVELGDKKVQGLDYAYTIQGWLKSVNGSALNHTQDIGKDGVIGSQYDPLQPNLHANVARDAFAFSLHYYKGDYKAIFDDNNHQFLGNIDALDPAVNPTQNDLFNSNIKMRVTGLMQYNGLAEPGILPVSIANYRYDQLDRITMATYRYADDAQFTNLQNTDEYKTTYSYDGNGNIKTLTRNGTVAKGLEMDNLTYHYEHIDGDETKGLKSNRLLNVNDTKPFHPGYDEIRDQPGYDPTSIATGNYGYDEIGNMTRDNQSGIERIDWNVYGKIKGIHRIPGAKKYPSGPNDSDLGDVDFAYDASANRVLKKLKPREGGELKDEDSWLSYYYVRDAEGNVIATYQKYYSHETDGSYTFHLEQLDNSMYGSKRLGTYKNTTLHAMRNFTSIGFNDDHTFKTPAYNNNQISTIPPCDDPICPSRYNFTTGLKQYELDDHLGNVQTVISDNVIAVDNGPDGIADYFKVDLLSVNDYYPFGSEMPDRTASNRGYKYGFNGKENDSEVKGEGNQQDYGMRIYDSRLGKFLSVDPLTPKYPELTPYQFASNTPIQAIDLDGLESNNVNNGPASHHNKPPVLSIPVSKNILRAVSTNHIEVNTALNTTMEKILPFTTDYKYSSPNFVTSVVETKQNINSSIITKGGQKYIRSTTTTTVKTVTFNFDVNSKGCTLEKLVTKHTMGLRLDQKIDKIVMTQTQQTSTTKIVSEDKDYYYLSSKDYSNDPVKTGLETYEGAEAAKYLDEICSDKLNDEVSKSIEFSDANFGSNAPGILEKAIDGGVTTPPKSKYPTRGEAESGKLRN
jgi:RHS repeat-associated protein